MKQRGMTLIEVVAAISLLALVVAAASRLMLWNIRAMRATDEAVARSTTRDLLLGRLKRDVWSAHTVTIAGDEAVLTTVDATITWRVLEDNGVARRKNDEQEQVWPESGERLRFGAARRGMTVGCGEGPAMLLISQVLQGGGR